MRGMWHLYFAREPWFTNDEPTSLEGFDEVAEFVKQHYPTLDDVFRVTQNIDEPWCIPPMRSMSVGDVVKDGDTGEAWLCAGVGWKLLHE